MGVTDTVLKDAWGEQILNANRMQYKGDEIDKLYTILIGDE